MITKGQLAEFITLRLKHDADEEYDSPRPPVEKRNFIDATSVYRRLTDGHNEIQLKQLTTAESARRLFASLMRALRHKRLKVLTVTESPTGIIVFCERRS